MMTDRKSFKDMLSTALEMEDKGYDFYTAQKAKAENQITKDMFSFLAQNELYHIESIKKFHKNLEAGGKIESVDISSKKDSRSIELDLFSENLDKLNEKLKPGDTDKQACEFAMEFEKTGYDYYKKMLESTDDNQAKKFLEFLLDEETKHYEIIEKMYNYLTDSANWFMYEEGSFPQG